MRRFIVVLSLLAVHVLALIASAVFDSKITGALGIAALLVIVLLRFVWLPWFGGDGDFDADI